MILIIVLFDENSKERTRYVLFYIFTAALILSHYTTAYIWFLLILVWFIVSVAARFFIRPLRAQLSIMKPLMLVIPIVFLFIWQISATHTTSALSNFATHVPVDEIISNQVRATSTATSISSSHASLPFNIAGTVKNVAQTVFFEGPDTNTNQNIFSAEQRAIHLFGLTAGYNVYSDPAAFAYLPTAINTDSYLTPKLPAFLSFLINLLARASKIIFIDIFPIIAIVGICFASVRRRQRNTTYDFMMLSVVAYLFLVVMLSVPYFQEYYNLTRLYLQMFLTLSVMAVIGGVMITKYIPRYQTALLTVLVILIFFSSTGALGQLIGGVPQIIFNQSPDAVDAIYYIHDGEIAGAQWLSTNRIPADPVQADDIATLRLQSFGNISPNNSVIFPQTLERQSYVYLIALNISQKKAFYEYQNNLLAYNYPLAFLGSHKNLIYNDGTSEVYH